MRDEAPQRTHIVVESKRRVMRKRLAEFSERAHRAAKLKGEVSILLTDGEAVRELNRRYRKKNKATDVLSFPAPRSMQRMTAGDLAIAVDVATLQAKRLGHSLTEEISILILHGLLHLAGHDHEADHGEMAEIEAALRKRLGLPLSLTERAVVSA
ncbi:MAG: rRNA maturation RNase YbeY [Acidobacteriales bacterium]|nr:rRNA maturation RNase YbeY [Terriglobales bacterium]